MTDLQKAREAFGRISTNEDPYKISMDWGVLEDFLSDPYAEVVDVLEEMRSDKAHPAFDLRFKPLSEALSRICSLADEPDEPAIPGDTGKRDKHGNSISMGQLVRFPDGKVLRVGFDPVSGGVCYLKTEPMHVAATPHMGPGLGNTEHLEALPFDWEPDEQDPPDDERFPDIDEYIKSQDDMTDYLDYPPKQGASVTANTEEVDDMTPKEIDVPDLFAHKLAEKKLPPRYAKLVREAYLESHINPYRDGLERAVEIVGPMAEHDCYTCGDALRRLRGELEHEKEIGWEDWHIGKTATLKNGPTGTLWKGFKAHGRAFALEGREDMVTREAVQNSTWTILSIDNQTEGGEDE